MVILAIIGIAVAVFGIYKGYRQYSEFLQMKYRFAITEWRSILLLLVADGLGALGIWSSNADVGLDNRIVALVIAGIILTWCLLQNSKQLGWTNGPIVTLVQMALGLIIAALVVLVLWALTELLGNRRKGVGRR